MSARARATSSFDRHVFNAGDYTRAVHQNVQSENITKVLYPDDSTPQGRQLRLEQQYFFVACSLKDALRASAGGKDVQINTRVDPNLLGGLVVKMGSRMIDSSLRTRLNNLKIAMKGTG